MQHDIQNLRSTPPIGTVVRPNGRSLDAALDSRVSFGSEAIQGPARDPACNGYKSLVGATGHAGAERRHSTSQPAHTSRYASLRADGVGRTTAQAGNRIGVLGTGSADRRAHRSVQCSCCAHRTLPNRLPSPQASQRGLARRLDGAWLHAANTASVTRTALNPILQYGVDRLDLPVLSFRAYSSRGHHPASSPNNCQTSVEPSAVLICLYLPESDVARW